MSITVLFRVFYHLFKLFIITLIDRDHLVQWV